MGSSRVDIFIDKYRLNQDKLLQRGIYFGRWFGTLLTLESNEYQSYMLKLVSNVVQKLCDLLGGRRGRSLKDHIGSQGGGQEGPKKDRIIFERSLTTFMVMSKM